ncbi:gamma-glutamyltransferase family protein [Burkholderia gladioli]|uniref:gamma-glutamyltransferase family protein n=1 Tax=Burkholderia gladioli TaxID=28095 RepID=UPI001FC85A5E|nr:gamma-glutamyltransferase family protein [Burkholderia gladioli]
MTDRPSPRPSPSRRQATLPAANPARRLAALAAAGLGLALAACGGANGPGAGNAAAGAAAVSASSSATLGTTAASGAAQRPPQTAFGGRVAEPASGWSDKPGWSSARSMIVAANPLAAQAGAEILKAGGSAVDAAIAAQLVLTLTEPQSSGLGGGALLLYADDKTTEAYDGLETAPAAASERLFLDRDGKLLGPAQTVAGGRPVGVPGTLRMLELAHRAHGKLPWKRLFQPAIKLADQGFPISPRLAALIAGDPYLRADPAARAYFYEQDGRPKTAGTLLRNPAYAATLRQLAAGGANPFYSGAIAREIAAKVGQSANPGLLTQQDLGRYRALPRTPFCGDYRKWTLCGMPPPASGGLAIAQMFGLFDGLPDWQKLGGQKLVRNDGGGLEPTPQAAHLFSEAGRLAYADRARYLADPERVPAPAGDWQRLVAPTYLAQRLQRIGDTSLGHAEAGVPADSTLATSFGDDPDALAPPPAASELAVVDHDGAVVAMASSLGDPFGSRLMVRGFLLNDALTGFSRTPRDHGRPIANRLDGGKRPRSSLTPEIAFERGTRRVALVLGGADAMPVAKTLAGVTDWGLTVAQAIALPNFGSRNGPTELEAGRVSDTLVEGLRRRGHEVRLVPITSDLVGLQRVALDGQSLWLGTADPRREGAAAGD